MVATATANRQPVCPARATVVIERGMVLSGLAAFALGAAPLAGGLLVGGMAGRGGPSAPDLRAIIKSELDLLERIPEDQVTRRAALEQVEPR